MGWRHAETEVINRYLYERNGDYAMGVDECRNNSKETADA